MGDLGSILTVERRSPRAMQLEEQAQVVDRSIPTAELVECTCPEPCERDHETD